MTESLVVTVLPPVGLQREGWGWPSSRGHSHLPPCKGSDGALPDSAARSLAAIGAAATTTATASIYDSGPPLRREQASAGGVSVGRSSLTRCSACKAPTLL